MKLFAELLSAVGRIWLPIVLGCLLVCEPVNAQFAYRTNAKADMYSIIDWNKNDIFPTDLGMPSGCVLILTDSCISAVDVDPTNKLRLPIMGLRSNHHRGYYIGYLRGFSNNGPAIPLFLATVIDTSNPQTPTILSTIEVNYFNDAARTADSQHLYAAPVPAVGVASYFLLIYNFPCPGPICTPTQFSLNNIGPNQIKLLPLRVVLSANEDVLWVAGVDASTHSGGGIAVIDTGIGGGANGAGNGPGKKPKVIAFIPCPGLGPTCL